MKTEFLLVNRESLPAGKPYLADGKLLQADSIGICGGMYSYFYERIVGVFGQALASASTQPNARVIVEIDSAGGYLHGCFEACAELTAIREKYPDVAVTIFTSGMLCSAAYAIASAMTGTDADEIVATPQALVGSIGVLVARWEEDLSQMGLQIHYFASGESKIEGRLGTKLTETEAAKLQADVDLMASKFYGIVSASRGLSAKDVKGLDADSFRGEKAQELGLVDRIVDSRMTLMSPAPEAEKTEDDDESDPSDPDDDDDNEPTEEDDQAMSDKLLQDELEASKAEIARLRAEQLDTLLSTRADLPEAFRTELKAMGYDAAARLLKAMPEPVKPEATKPAPLPTVVAPLEGVAELHVPVCDDDKLQPHHLSALNSQMPRRQLTEKQLKRSSYDPETGTLKIR